MAIALGNLKQSYSGKDITECFVILQLHFRKEIDTFRTKCYMVKRKEVGLESFVENCNEKFMKNVIPNLENVEKRERQKLEIWLRKMNVAVKGAEDHEHSLLARRSHGQIYFL